MLCSGQHLDWCGTLRVRSRARANITAALSAHRPRLPACKDSLHLTFYPPNSRSQNPLSCLFGSVFFTTQIFRLRYVPCIFPYPVSLWDKSLLLSPPAYLAARQIAPLVSKWPQQKDNDKRAVSQLSFPPSAPASHITVIDCSVSGSAIVPQDTRESCQEL